MTPSPTPPAAVGSDRRVAPRFQPAFGTTYRFPDGGHAVGLVWNISQTGVSMLLADPPERGALVAGELHIDGGPPLNIAVRVVHVRPVSTGDYLLGGQFSRPLEPEELQRFLTPPPREKPDPGRG